MMMQRSVWFRTEARCRLYSTLPVWLIFICCLYATPIALANQGKARVVRVEQCQAFIQGRVGLRSGEVVSISKSATSAGAGTLLGQIVLEKVSANQATGRVIRPESECTRVLGGFVVGRVGLKQRARQAPRGWTPSPVLRASLSTGPGISFSTLKGLSRTAIVESYALSFTALNVATEVYPLSFFERSRTSGAGSSLSWRSWLGIEGTFRYLTTVGEVKVVVPSLVTGEEVNLNLGLSRVNGRGGGVVRVPVWRDSLFFDTRAGYYSHTLTSTIKKIVKAPEGEVQPFAISPLRNISYKGLYLLGGVQFQPVKTFRSRVSTGILLAPSAVIDNRLADAAAGTSPVNKAVRTPSGFVLEANVNYVFSWLQMGLDIALDSYSGNSLFPDDQTDGALGESHSVVGLNLSVLL